MSEILQAIEFHLGRKMKGQDWNYYSLLGLKPSATPEEIKTALKASAAAWNASDRKTDPARAQKVAQLLREAQATLLDAPSREAYIRTLRGASEPDFLSFDPTASFDPAQLPSQDFTPRWPSPSARYAGLVSVMERTPRLSDSPLPESPRPSPQRTAFQANPSVLPSRSVGGSPMGQTGGSTGDGPAPSSAASRILALKRKRQRQQIITVSIILVAATGFLSYAALQFAANQKRLAKQDTPQNVAPAELQREFEDGMKANAARESDLAPVPSDLPTLPMDERKDPPEEMGDSEGVASLPSPFDIKPIELPPELVNAKESSEPPRAAMPMENVSPPPGPTPSAPDATAIDTNTTGAAGKEKWNAAMKAGREALAKTDFQAFAKAMESAIQLPMTSEMEAKQKRLDQVGQLYQIAVDAMREARTKTRGTEEITVGKNLVNIVEVTEDAIIVRVAGKNERYNWNQLPLGLALAMSDLTLSDREPTDLAARAVYLSLAPNKTGLYDKKIREFFDKSLGKGEIRTDLPQAFTDSYE